MHEKRSQNTLNLLLSCVVWESNPHIGFRSKLTLLLRSDTHFTMAEVQFLPLDDRWQHHLPPSPYWNVLTCWNVFKNAFNNFKCTFTDFEVIGL